MMATTMSPHAYVSGNPLNGTDPSGLDDGCAWWDAPCHAAAILAAAEAKAAELASHARAPDYVSLNVGAGPLPGGIDNVIPGTSGGVNITVSRSGHIFFTPQTGLSTPGFSASLRGGWINQWQKPSCDQVDNYIKGPSVGVDSYQPIGDGVFGPSEGVTWGNPGGFKSSDTSTEFGVGAGWGHNLSAQGGYSQQLPFSIPSWGN